MVGGTGTVLVPMPGGRAKAQGVARQPDGKLVVVGSVGENSTQDLFVARFYPDGSLDGGFGSGGVVTADFGARYEAGWDVAVQPDGRLVVAASGEFDFGPGYGHPSTDLVVLRYYSDGRLDSGFASGGVLRVASQSFGAYFGVKGVGLARDGTIFVGGETGLTYRLDSNTATIARVRGDGSFDRFARLPGDWRAVTAMSLDQRRRRIYLAGSTPRRGAGIDQVMLVAAVRTGDLSVATGFGSRGLAHADVARTNYDFAAAVISDRRGRIVLAGAAANDPPGATPARGPRSRFAVARFTPAGKLDPRFGRRGMARVGFPYRQSVAFGVVEHPAGRLVLAGIGADGSEVRPSNGCALAVARLAAR
jgi:uncharacterized delta-60 repeat protein